MPKIPPKRKAKSGPKQTHKPSKSKRAPKATAVPTQDTERNVVYPEFEVVIYRDAAGDSPLNASMAKEYLGWEAESAGTSGVKFGNDFLLKDCNGKKIRCYNNTINRPFYPWLAQMWAREILNGNWCLNGETIIIGRSGQVLAGQHRLVALILAEQMWMKDREEYPYWKTGPTIDVLVVRGVDEEDKVVNTIDTAKPRDFSDVLYRSELFSNLLPNQRLTTAKACESALKLLWVRVGGRAHTGIAKRTHAESMDFINHHPKLVDCVRHIMEENGKSNRIKSRYLSSGYAAGLMYLMGCAGSNPIEYWHAEHPSDEALDWSQWDRAKRFWVLLAKGDATIEPVHEKIAEIMEEGSGTVAERCAVLAKAWLCYADGDKITTDDLSLEYHISEEGQRRLINVPSLGGLDQAAPDEENEPDPTPEEIEERKEQIRQDRPLSKAQRRRAKRKGKRS